MFRRNNPPTTPISTPAERVTTVLGPGINWEGKLRGSGGVRIESTFEGEISLKGLVVVGETGKVTCEHLRANTVVVAGAVRGNITTQKLEIRSTGRVWGDVVTTAFVTDEGAFLRGQIRMEETVDLELEKTSETAPPEAAKGDTGATSASASQPKAPDGSTLVARKKSTP